MVPAQEVRLPGGEKCTEVHDSGSQITLISNDCAKSLEARQISQSTVQIIGIGKGHATPHQVVEVSLPGQEGKPISFKVHSVPELSIGVAVHDAEEIGKVFPHIVKTYVSLPTGALTIYSSCPKSWKGKTG